MAVILSASEIISLNNIPLFPIIGSHYSILYSLERCLDLEKEILSIIFKISDYKFSEKPIFKS